MALSINLLMYCYDLLQRLPVATGAMLVITRTLPPLATLSNGLSALELGHRRPLSMAVTVLVTKTTVRRRITAIRVKESKVD